MEQFLQPVMEYFLHHPMIGIFFTFIIAFIESLPLLGTLFPGSITMTAIGALAGALVLPPVAACVAAIIGAFMGDCLGFWLGSRYHETIRLAWPFNRLSKYLAYSEKFFAKHGGKSIIIGRFIGPTRAAMPLIAGLLLFTWKQFLPAAALAAILWSLIYMAPGILLGALAVEFPHGEMTKIFFSGLAAIAGLWLVFWLLQFFFKQLSRAINYRIQLWWMWLSQPEAGFFVRLIRNRQHVYDYRQLKLCLLFLLTSGLFLLLWANVSRHGWATGINEPLFYLTQSFRTPAADSFWALLTVLGCPEALLIASLLAGLGLALYRQWRASTHIVLAGLLSAATVETVKKLYFSARPAGLALVESSSSFPSGHTALSVTVLGFLAFLTAKIIPRGWRGLVYTFFILLIFLIGLSRLFLGQHWFTDILGGGLLGVSVLLFITLSYRRAPKTRSILRLGKTQWLAILLFSTVLPWSGAGLLTFQHSLRNSQPVWPRLTLNFQQWWRQPTQGVPLYRPDRFGHIVAPFNVQWAGSLEKIQTFLLSRGWELAEQRSCIRSALQCFTSLQPEDNLPLLSLLYQNKPPVAFFIKRLQNSPDILELQLWASGVQYAGSPLPLWLGVLTYHTPPEKRWRFPHRYIHWQSGNILITSPRQMDGVMFQSVHIAPAAQPEKIRALHWDGDIFILKPAAV